MATITLDKTIIKAGETAVVTFTVEKTHFMGTTNRSGVRTVNDVTIIGGTISAGYDFQYVEALSTPTTQVYQGTFTPTPNLDRTECTIRYNPDGTPNHPTTTTSLPHPPPPPRSIKPPPRLPRTGTEPSAPSATTLTAPPTTPPAPPSSSTPGRPPSRAPRRSPTTTSHPPTKQQP